MHRNLMAEMARHGYKLRDVQAVLGKTDKTISDKIKGKRDFSVTEAFAIQRELFPELDINYLFESAS